MIGEVYLVVRARNEVEASKRVHDLYDGVRYIVDVFTPLQMEFKKRLFRPAYYGSTQQTLL